MTDTPPLEEKWRVAVGRAPLHDTPDEATPLSSELILGENFTVLERSGDWMRGRNEFDGYVGWTPADSLGEGPADPATHVVVDQRAFVYPGPSMKNPVEDELPMGARVVAVAFDDAWVGLSDGGWIYGRHLAPPDRFEPDIVAAAERFLGIPYLWGGRTPFGFDCSGLTQTVLARAGVAIARDSGPQRESVGNEISPSEVRRGDLLFFPGHVAIARDALTVVHANAFTMNVAIERAEDVTKRAGGLLKVRRPVIPA